MKKRLSILALMMTMIFTFAACAKAEVKDTEGKVQVGVTIYPLQYFAERIGGDKVNVFSIIPEGSDAHTFDPKPKDLANLNDTDVFVYNGLGMEEWIDSILTVVEGSESKIVEASYGIEALPTTEEHDHSDHEEDDVDHDHEGETAEEHAAHDHEGETAEEHAAHDHEEEHTEDHEDHNHGEFDPHVWLSLDLAVIQAENIKNALIDVDSQNASYYEANFEELKKDLISLKNEFTEKMSSLKNKEFVTGHAAFGYLTHDFGLNQSSIADVFGEGELTAKHLEELINFAKEHNVKVIFNESTSSSKESETLAKEIGATVEKIYSLETKEDDLNYLDGMRYNLEKIYESLNK